MKYTIDVPNTPQKRTDLVVIIIDDEHKTSSSFALGKRETSSIALKLIKSAIKKVSLLNKVCETSKSTPKKPKKNSVKKPKSKKK